MKSYHRDESGLTLVELMVVLAMVAVVTVIAGRALSRPDNAQVVDRLANNVLLALRQARNTAVNTGRVVAVRFDPSVERVFIVGCADVGTFDCTSGTWIAMTQFDWGAKAVVQAIRNAAETGIVSAPGNGGLTNGLNGELRFLPDGSSTAATVYLRDASDSHKRKVVLFAMTGYSHLYTRW